MKKLLFSILVIFFSFKSLAVSYPPEAYFQHVRVLHQGPMLIGTTYYVVGRLAVMGYKKSGSLNQFHPERLDAVITYTCVYGGVPYLGTKNIELGPEWNGTGYMSEPFSFDDIRPTYCPQRSRQYIRVAFSDRNGNWDNGGLGLDYRFTEDEIYQSSHYRNTRQGGAPDKVELGSEAWKFIVEEMRR